MKWQEYTVITKGFGDESLIQYHIIDIKRNHHIKGLQNTKKEEIKGSFKRRKKYKVIIATNNKVLEKKRKETQNTSRYFFN